MPEYYNEMMLLLQHLVVGSDQAEIEEFLVEEAGVNASYVEDLMYDIENFESN